MRALRQLRFGTADDLQLETVEDPTLTADDQVLVRVHAVSINFGDLMMLQGHPRLFRPMYGSARRIPGMDLAGVVEAVGSAVTRFQPGDAVLGECAGGSLAELCVVREDQIVLKPDTLSFVEAGAVAVAGGTAAQGLREAGTLEEGQRVLINGASGGVGSFAVQIARAMGASVTAVCSARNADQARASGADEIIDYTVQDWTTGDPRYDLVFDLVGNHRLSERRRVLLPGGRYVASFGQGGGDWLGPVGRIAQVALAGLFGARVSVFSVVPGADELERLLPMLEDGRVRPMIEKVYPLEQAADAFRDSLAGHARGKRVIQLVQGP